MEEDGHPKSIRACHGTNTSSQDDDEDYSFTAPVMEET